MSDCPADMSGIHAGDEDGACLNCDQWLVGCRYCGEEGGDCGYVCC